MPKEHLEVFTDGTSYVIEDFEKLRIFGKKECKETVIKEQDKGHRKLIEEIQKDLKGEENILVPFSLDFNSSDLSIRFVNIMRGME